ncbi:MULTISPECIES: hypothetical protein [unclassified Lentimonas]|uniref:hypothetical protein n=1 Tax=unclassified Lentimonas TaxID=2630993 RepID=UPI00132C05E2|nr:MULTISPECIES: hypothetical protein [unclassified Lentimonas]CAA6691296.1 Unannotated [Lentimonas sp. CC19]CAA6694876.1 Unannotated [Lentimonas sp. CC10]CAA7071932.1 Unannotated [Lentimonas sp. CC11]
MKILIAALASFSALMFFAGCANTEYVGQTYSPTTHVDVYMSAGGVTRPHTQMGMAKTEATEYMSFEDMQQQLMRDAMAKGADGIIITGMQTVNVGSSSYTSGQNKKSDPEYYITEDGKLKERNKHSKGSYSEVSTTTQMRDHVLSAQLIKYQ